MSFELYFNRGRSDSQVVTLYQADGDGLTLAGGDVVRFKVYRRNNVTPALDINSSSALSGGSVISVTQTGSAAIVQIDIVEDDTSDLLGAYDAELIVIDSADSDRAKLVESGTVFFLPSGGGSLG